jgi:multidrug efflux pump subunit AcrB
MLGVILLAGIVVNNAILLVEYTESGRRRGLTRAEAVIEAGTIRLRPIVMTTLTTVCGMLPLALGIGQGSELMQPLAIAVVGGLSVSMLLTLFVVPSAYVILNAAAERLGRFVTGRGRRSEPTRPVRPPRVPAEVGAD